MKTATMILLTAAALTVSGCKREPVQDGNANASGEVLPGSISDAMLPADRLTSQPPLDPRADRPAATAGASSAPTGTEAAADGAEVAAEPVITPPPAPRPDPSPAAE